MSSDVYEGPSGLACAVGVLPATIALFKGLRIVGRPLLDAYLRSKKIEATPDKLDKGIGYIISTVHALANAGFSTYKLMSGSGIASLQPSTWLCRYHAIGTIGYMLEDLWDFRHEWREQLIYVFHHLSVIVVVGSTNIVPEMRRYGPLWGITEYSTVFLNAIWLIKEWGGGDANPLLAVMQKGFALSFFLLRVLWMPYTWIAINRRYPQDTAKLGKILWCAYSAIVGLQLYWAALIVNKYILQPRRIRQDPRKRPPSGN